MNPGTTGARIERRNARTTGCAPRLRLLHESAGLVEIVADVLVVGGGPAAMWAALGAAEQGADVVLVDKGHCGASGVAATAGVGHWTEAPGTARRAETMALKERTGQFLSDTDWVEATLDENWRQVSRLPGWGWERGNRGAPAVSQRPSLLLEDDGAEHVGPYQPPFFRGPAPDYTRFLRGRVLRAGVLVLDHSPAVELLRDASTGAVAGARGHQLREHREWVVRAGAVILATGGTAWKSKSLGADVNTGDGQLMAAEVGARLSGMEFSNFQGMVPLGTSMDKNGFFIRASYWDHTGAPIDYVDLHESRVPLLERSLQGTVTAQFTQFPAAAREKARRTMPNFFMVADKLGVDPFTERFPIDWVNEGTVRGTGGIYLPDRTCGVGVPGLYAAGDTAARDRIVGAANGAGGPNLAWAVASGTWSGRDAAGYALSGSTTWETADLVGAGLRGARPGRSDDETATDTASTSRLLSRVQAEVLPLDKSVMRSEGSMRQILRNLDGVWDELGSARPAAGLAEVRMREVTAMAAMARWSNATALQRRESRGMHYRTDHPDLDPGQARRLLTAGVDDIVVVVDPNPPRATGHAVSTSDDARPGALPDAPPVAPTRTLEASTA